MTPKERQEILDDIRKNGFKFWPKPKEGTPYGPFPSQWEAITIPHKHELDICLLYGGGRSGKSISAIVAGLAYLFANPGIDIMIGCEQYKHLERTTLNDYRKVFSIHSDFDHPLVAKRVTTHNKFLRLVNKATAWFMHFKEFEILRGTNLGFAQIEEASLVTDGSVLGEIIRRMSSTLVKQKQIMVTSNPEENHSWIYETFELERFEPGYDGPPHPLCGENLPYPNKEYWESKGYDLSKSFGYYVGKPCNCQLCQDCLNQDRGEFEYIDGVCPQCKSKKDVECPGNQYFKRVIFVDPKDNPHLSSTYRQTQKLSTSEKEFNLYTKGDVIELRTGKCYDKFSRRNILSQDKPLDYDKEMYWNHDFNISCAASCIVQESTLSDGSVYAEQIDEIVLPESGPADVAVEFLRRYHAFNQTVFMYFDPAAFNRSITADDGMIRIKMIRERLENPEKFRYKEGDLEKRFPLFPRCEPKKLVLLTKKEAGKTKILQTARVDSVNNVLDNGAGVRKFFINPKCIWTIKSLQNIKWKIEGGKPSIDTAQDKLAAKAADKTVLRPLTHPTDALGYYIYNRFPLVKAKHSEMYAYLPGSPLIKTTSDGLDVEEIPERHANHKMLCIQCDGLFPGNKDTCPIDGTKLLAKERDPRLIYEIDGVPTDPVKVSLRQYLDLQGAFDPIDENPFSMYW